MKKVQNMLGLRVRHRPRSLIWMTIFLFVQGIVMVIGGLFGIFGVVMVVFDAARAGELLLHGVLSFVLGVLSIILATGVLMLARWAFWVTIAVALISLMHSAAVLIQTGLAAWLQLFPLILSLLILLFFLLDDEVRAAFFRADASGKGVVS
ncbi:MAG: hypothetical protein J2P36_08365 [Ktedonobacteraceae bacterium]|nr:hypothetical protein [Ktedonobacteraceae bacterium]